MEKGDSNRVNFVNLFTIYDILDKRAEELSKNLPDKGDLDKYQMEDYAARNEICEIRNLIQLAFE